MPSVSKVNYWDEFFEFLSFTNMPMTAYFDIFAREQESLNLFTDTHDLKVIKNSDIVMDLYHVIKGRRDSIDYIKANEITKIYFRVLGDKFLKDLAGELTARGIVIEPHRKHS